MGLSKLIIDVHVYECVSPQIRENTCGDIQTAESSAAHTE